MSMSPKIEQIMIDHNIRVYYIERDQESRTITFYTLPEATEKFSEDMASAVEGPWHLQFEVLPEKWATVASGNKTELKFDESSKFNFTDNVNHPSHYASGKIEVIEAIEDWCLNFHRGNAVKYTARAGKKDPTKEIEDLSKAVWYLNREIECLKSVKETREKVRPNDMKKD